MSENEMTPERPFNKAEVEDVFGILRSQDSILGIRLVDRLYATLQSALSRLEEAERELEQWRAEKQDAEHPKIRPMTRLEHAMMDMQRDLGSELSAQKTRYDWPLRARRAVVPAALAQSPEEAQRERE